MTFPESWLVNFPVKPEDAALLALTLPHAVMVIDEVSFDQSAVPVILAHHRFSTEYFMYVNEIR